MSKKADLVVMPVSGDNIDSSIDMKLTKQDLIDMVIEETRDVLETQVRDANDAYNKVYMQVQSAQKKQQELLIQAIRAKHKKEFKLLSTYGKEGHISFGNDVTITERGIFSYRELETRRTRDARGFNRAEYVLDDGKIVILQAHSLPSGINLRSETNGKKDALVDIQIRLELALSKDEVNALYAPFLVLVKELATAQTTLSDLQDQLKSVDKMGKKAKTQLIKRMLESSGNGQAILANMGSIKHNVGQLLLDSVKKA